MKYVWIVTNDYDGDICGVFSTAAAARKFIKDEIDRWARINDIGDEELQQNYDELNGARMTILAQNCFAMRSGGKQIKERQKQLNICKI